MLEPDFFLRFVVPLNKLGARYMVTGSVASGYYGEPRNTLDVDLVVFLNDKDVVSLQTAFPKEEFYVPPLETIFAETRREQRGHFNLIHNPTGFKADIYLVGRDELNAWGFRFKRTVSFEDVPVVLAPPEYVIVRKLEYYREGHSEKHLHDVRSILAISGSQLDQAALNDWIQRMGLAAEWQSATA
jgi:hypothetical protein